MFVCAIVIGIIGVVTECVDIWFAFCCWRNHSTTWYMDISKSSIHTSSHCCSKSFFFFFAWSERYFFSLSITSVIVWKLQGKHDHLLWPNCIRISMFGGFKLNNVKEFFVFVYVWIKQWVHAHCGRVTVQWTPKWLPFLLFNFFYEIYVSENVSTAKN